MGLRYRCFLDSTEVEEPINLDTLELSLLRDEALHGIGFEASTDTLEFTGDGATYLENVKNCLGLKAQITFLAEALCDDESGEYQQVIKGKVNFSAYKKICGDYCSISVPIESVTCETIMRNQFDQPVDLDNQLCSDGFTVLPAYGFLGEIISLPTKFLDYRTEGSVAEASDDQHLLFPPSHHGDAVIWVRPEYLINPNNNIQDSHLVGGEDIGYVVLADAPGKSPIISSQVLFNETNIKCFPSPFLVTGRLKGHISLPGTFALTVKIQMIRGDIFDINQINVIETVTIATNESNLELDFDHTFTPYNWQPVASGVDNIFHLIQIIIDEDSSPDGHVIFDSDTFFSAVGTKACPPTDTKAYLIHETLSRITESITNLCCRVKSSYYGRKDSAPFEFDTDGCGGLRFVTSGLKVRNAPAANFFCSLKKLVEGLQAIDNIGMGVEEDTEFPNRLLLRVEGIDFFYRDLEIMRCDSIPKLEEDIEAGRAYNSVLVGYKTWKTLDNFGLDEFNSDRNYRTPLIAVNTGLDIRSELVAGEYALEITREQQFADTSAADTLYDDQTFIVLLKRMAEAYGYPYGQMIVEQGNVSAPENIYSPGSVINYGISPLRNLMRWFRSIAASFPNITDSDNKLSFSSGTGNLLAKGELSAIYGGSCKLEAFPVQENQNLTSTQFLDINDATPLWRNEQVTFDYPMSLADYQRIKSNPYGYISYQCGNGEFQQGWVKEIRYRPTQGTSTIILRKRWAVLGCEPFAPGSPVIPTPPPTIPLGLRLVWDDIANVPVGDPSSLADWNTFFLASDSTSVEVDGNTVTLFGSTDFQFWDGVTAPLRGNTHILEIHDEGNCVKRLGGAIQPFQGCPNLNTVSFPFIDIGVGTELPELCFGQCSLLANVNLPTVKIVSNLCFQECFALVSIDLPEATYLQASFVGCSGLVSINIPNVVTIFDQVFENCTSLEEVSAPLCTSCGNGGNFLSCTALRNVSLPLCASIADFDFLSCTALETLDLSSCDTIGSTTGDDSVFFGIAGQNITLTLKTGTETDGDVITLQSNNTVTLILV